MSETERDLWAIHDRRLSEQDNKINITQRGIDDVERELEKLVERINMGVSPTQNKILEKQSTIELAISNLDHKMETRLSAMEANQEKQLAVVVVEQQIQGKALDALRNILIYGVIATVLTFGIKTGFDYFSENKPQQSRRK